MKVFISHQQADSIKAAEIAQRLRIHHQIDSYLDVIDSKLSLNGEELGEYIRGQMGACSQLIAVVSHATKASQWVPWEIGVATEKSFPLATFTSSLSEVPEFIRSWPVLKSMAHVDEYARASKSARQIYATKRAATLNESASVKSSTESFYRTLRANL